VLKRQIYLPALVLVVLAVVATLHTKFFIQKEPTSDVSAPVADPKGSNSEGSSIEVAYPKLANLFPQGDWRRSSGNLFALGDDVGFFIFKGEPYCSEDGMTLTFNACTLVALPPKKEGITDEERYQTAFVFESNESVSVTLDCSLADFTQFKAGEIGISNIKEGRVQGEIVVRSSMGTVESDDDFELRARDVVFNLHQIVANLEVSLRYGRNSCVGRGLTLDLDVPSRLTARNVKRSTPETSGERNIQRVDELVEEGNIGGGFSLRSAHLAAITDCFRYYYQKPNAEKQDDSPDVKQTSFEDSFLEVRCNRGVFFSSIPGVIGGWCARFNKGVDLVSYRNGIKAEQALCETLYLYLQDSEVEQLAQSSSEIKERLERKKITGSLAKLEPTTIRALKRNADDASSEDPQVEIRLETKKTTLKADEIVYDLRARRLNLVGSERNRVRVFSSDELDSAGELKRLDFTAEFVQAQLSERNELETVFAGKNGELTTEFEGKEGEERKLNVTWEKGLRIAPEPKSVDVLKLTSAGAVAFRMDDIGSFDAKEADFWCKISARDDAKQAKISSNFQTVAYVDKSTNNYEQFSESEDANGNLALKQFKGITPIGAEFRGNVSFNAPRGKATIHDKVVLRFASELKDENNALENVNVEVQNTPRSFFSDSSLTGDKDDSKFEIQSRQMSLWCIFDDANQRNVDLRRLQLQGDVSLVERASDDGTEKMRINAEVAQVDLPSSSNASVRLAGRTDAPALFRTNNLELTGADVFVDRATNSFQVSGAGKLDFLPPLEALDAQRKNDEISGFFTNDPIEIRWSNSMTLEKNVLSFRANPQDRVVVSQKTQSLACSELRIKLKNNVSLFDGDSFKQKKLDFERLDCIGSYESPVEINAFQNNGTNVQNGEIQEGRYYAKLNNLSYLPFEDKIVSNSGGEFRAVVKAKGGFKTVEEFEASKQKKQETSKNAQNSDWTRVHAKFQGELVGRPKLHEATAANGVRIVVGQTNDPDANLDVDVPSTFPEQFALVTGKEASVKVDVSNAATTKNENSQKAIEIETRNSVVFKSSDVIGRCDTLRYSSQKNAVVMTGSSARKAELYRQEGAGRPKELLGEFSRASYRLDTEAFEIESFSFNGN